MKLIVLRVLAMLVLIAPIAEADQCRDDLEGRIKKSKLTRHYSVIRIFGKVGNPVVAAGSAGKPEFAVAPRAPQLPPQGRTVPCTFKVPTCGPLSCAEYQANGSTPPAAPTAPAGPGAAPGGDPAKDGPASLKIRTNPLEVLVGGEAIPTERVVPGRAHSGLETGVAEALQILGQIVVDRATSHAYRLIQDKLIQLLKCDGPKSPLPRTCSVIRSVRVQDLAASPRALARALLEDGVSLAVERLIADTTLGAEVRLELQRAAADLVSMLVRKDRDIDTGDVEAITSMIVGTTRLLAAKIKAPGDKAPATKRHEQAAIVAVAALLECDRWLVNATRGNQAGAVPTCPIGDVVDEMLLALQKTPNQIGTITASAAVHARSIAVHLYQARSLTTDGRAVPRERMRHVVAALLEIGELFVDELVAEAQESVAGACETAKACNLSDEKSMKALLGVCTGVNSKLCTAARAFDRSKIESTKAFDKACAAWKEAESENARTARRAIEVLELSHSKSIETLQSACRPCKELEQTKLVGLVRTVRGYAITRALVLAAIEDDTNRLVTEALHAFELAAWPKASAKQRKAFRLLAGLIQYAGTYVAGESAESAHEARKQLLDSLTAEMTDRTGRDGDDIWSIGGSLRGVAGARFGEGGPAFNGPLALPLGFGFQSISDDGGGGFHAELGVVDLGQYVSFDQEGNVREPDVEDVLAPSLTGGVFWGKQVPMFVGLSVGYSPHYRFDDDDDGWGSVNFGFVAGAYVPLIDLN